ncbi:hypothetical protein L195_g056667 [Trifolium pratense]|uniref:Uncharacterized protein n=1 Tax=Trifolium pratense TaxID=57577 RepID=A0A2K3KST2_TRIPR|nr:hypothetical protein L195_g056667 [Trifolium pratense]
MFHTFIPFTFSLKFVTEFVKVEDRSQFCTRRQLRKTMVAVVVGDGGGGWRWSTVMEVVTDDCDWSREGE